MVDLEILIKINESGKKALEYTDKIFNLLERMRADLTAQAEHPMHFTIGSTPLRSCDIWPLCVRI